MEIKIDNPSIESKVLIILNEAENPVSIDYVRYNLKSNWSTTRAILLSLALEGKISSQKTSKSWIFWLDKDKGERTP